MSADVPAAGGASTACPSVGAAPPPGAVAVPLDLHEGIWDPRVGCTRWPRDLRLRNEVTGELVKGRCKSSNLCLYCRVLAVVETAEMLSLDAAEYAPTLWIVLTAREHLTRRDTYGHLHQLRVAVKRRWPAVEWFVQVEFQKRGALHLNLLVKGVPQADADRLLEVVSARWCSRVDALPVGQHIEALGSAEAVTRYLQKELSHGLKREQAPPIGWRGHRTSQSRGYFVAPASVMRARARESLRRKRELWKRRDRLDQAHDVELEVTEALRIAADSVWVLATDRGALVSGSILKRGSTAPRPAAAAAEDPLRAP